MLLNCLTLNNFIFDLDEDLINWLKTNGKEKDSKLLQKFYSKKEIYRELHNIMFFPEIKQVNRISSEEYIQQIENISKIKV